MITRRFRGIAILVAVLALLIAACGPQETETPEPTEEAVATEEVVDEEADAEAVEETEEAADDEATEEAMDDEDMADAEATEEAMGDEDMADAEATEEAMGDDEDMADDEATEEAMDDDEDMADAEATEEAMDDEDMDDMSTIVDLAVATEDLSILVQAVTAAELAETLSGEGPFTVFAPTNAAFEAAIEALGTTAEDLLADTELLTSVLTYHVIAGEVLSTDLTDGMEATTVNGEVLTIGVSDEGVTVTDVAGNTVNVTTADVTASNGVVHIIDGVLLPIAAEEDEAAMGDEEAMDDEDMADDEAMEDMGPVVYDDGSGFTFEYSSSYEINEGDGSYTLQMGEQSIIVVAPSIFDFVAPPSDETTPEERLSTYAGRIGYEVGEPADMMMAAASVNISLERRGQVGFANLIDLGNEVYAVVLELGPDADNVPSADGGAIADSMVYTSIVRVAQATEDLSTLVAAVAAADLVGTLDTGGPFTVFAPTNAAFEAAIEALGTTAEDLLADTETLTSILTYHVVSGEVLSEALTDGQEVTTLNGAILTIGVSDDGVTVTDGNGSTYNVVTADVDAGNGVVHIIDGVLVPPAPEAEEEAMDDEDMAEEEEAADADGDMEETQLTILGTALQADGLETLATALVRGGFSSTFNGEGSFTVFAPTDEAFAAALEALGLTAEELLADTELLSSVLTYHVIDGEVFSDALEDGMEVETLNGATLTIGVTDEGVTVTDANGNVANVVTADVDASNGVVHVIDGVLLPPSGE
ncbi:MAG: fasciclin domain-containing protein [Chloroflexota bacterium]